MIAIKDCEMPPVCDFCIIRTRCDWYTAWIHGVRHVSQPKPEGDECRLIDLKRQDRWVPVSEALPEDYTDVLVWFEYFRYGDYNCMYQTYGIGTYFARYDSWMINHESGWRKLRVIAWRPLPEPYQEDKA